jgi:hypothetical protein
VLACDPIEPKHYIYLIIFFSYICFMNYQVIIENRLRIGFALGFAWYRINEEYDYGDIILFLGLISINIKYGYEI